MSERYTTFEPLNELVALVDQQADEIERLKHARAGWRPIAETPESNDFALYVVWNTRCAAGDHATWAVYGNTNYGKAWMTPARILLRPSHWMFAEDAFDLKTIPAPTGSP